jgi:hypothetical protein
LRTSGRQGDIGSDVTQTLAVHAGRGGDSVVTDALPQVKTRIVFLLPISMRV